MSNVHVHQTMAQDFLGNATRITFITDESNVKNETIVSHGGIDGTIKIVDISSLPIGMSQKDMEKALNNMGDKMPVIGTARFQCESREMGDIKLDILSLTGDAVLRIERRKRFGILWLADGDKEIPARFSDGTTAAVVRVSKTAGSVEIDVAGEQGLYFKRWIPAWQARTKWILCAFLCFLPTFAVGSCFGFYKASTSDVIHKMTKHSLGTVIDLGDSLQRVVSFEGASTWKEKLTLLTLGAYMITDELTDTPVSHHTSSSNF